MKNLNKNLIFKIREAGRYLHPRPADKNRQKEILVFLSENGTIPQRELTRRLKIKPPSVSELLRKLEDVNLIRRVPNEYDRRNMNVELTDLGLVVAEEYKKSSKDSEEELFAVLTSEEKEELSLLLDKLLEYWEEILGPEPPKPEHRPHHDGPIEHPRPPHHGPENLPRPPHEEIGEPHRPPHEFNSEPLGPFNEIKPKVHHEPSVIEPDFELFGTGPKTWSSFFEILNSVIESISEGKSPLTPPDNKDFAGSTEIPIPPDELNIPQDEGPVLPEDEPILPEDDELPPEPDLELNVEETENDKS